MFPSMNISEKEAVDTIWGLMNPVEYLPVLKSIRKFRSHLKCDVHVCEDDESTKIPVGNDSKDRHDEINLDATKVILRSLRREVLGLWWNYR